MNEEIFSKNIETLSNVLMDYYIEQIKSANMPQWAKVINSEDDTPNLLITKGVQKKSIYPIQGWKQEIYKRIDEMKFSDSTATIIIGIGLGFFLKKAIESSEEKHKFIVVEPNAGLLKQALSYCDFSKAIIDKKLLFTPTTEDIAYTLELFNEKYVIDDWHVIIEGYTINNPAYMLISSDAINLLNQVRCNIGTVSSAGKQIANNDIANLPYIIHRRGVNELENLYKGLPAVMVATGPSLRKNIHFLIKNQDKVIIIAVGQALRPLLSYGIKPDFICSVDFGEVNLTHYDGLMESDVPLVALNRSFAPLLKRWQGPVFVSASTTTILNKDEDIKNIQDLIAQKGWLIQGGSVAHMCLGLAIKLGCNPIAMIGQDLAYDTEQSHFEQADSRGTLKYTKEGELKWEVKDPRCHLHNKDFSMGVPVTVPGYFLKGVKTNVGLASFITSFERYAKEYSHIKIINATEGGAHINHTTRMSLKRYLKTYCNTNIRDKKEKIKPLLTNCKNALSLIDKAIPLIDSEIIILNKIINRSRKALKTNKELESYADTGFRWTSKNKSKYDKVVAQNTRYSNEAHKEAVKMPLVQLAIYGANRLIQTPGMKVKSNMDNSTGIDYVKDYREDYLIRLKRNRIILRAALDSALSLKDTYKTTLSKLKKAKESKNLNLLCPKIKEPVPNLSDANQYFEEGNFARPMLEARKIIDNHENFDIDSFTQAQIIFGKAFMMCTKAIKEAKKLPDQSDYIDCIQLVCDAQEIGRDERNFDKALEMLKKAEELDTTNEIAKWGLATAYFHTKRYDEALEIYNDLLNINPDNPRYLFEMGQVLIYSNKVSMGISAIMDAMSKTSEFDSFYCILGDLLAGMFKNFKEAVRQYQLYLDRFPADYEVWIKLSKAAEQDNQTHLAETALDKANKIRS